MYPSIKFPCNFSNDKLVAPIFLLLCAILLASTDCAAQLPESLNKNNSTYFQSYVNDRLLEIEISAHSKKENKIKIFRGTGFIVSPEG